MAAKKRARGSRRLRPKQWPWWLAIGEELEKAVAVAETDSITKRLAREKVFTPPPKGPYPYSVVPRFSRDLIGLGRALKEIALGEDARVVFGQLPGTGRDSRQVEIDHRATLYWHWRNEGMGVQEAVTHALKSWPTREGKAPNARTLIKAAGKAREDRLDWVEGRTYELVEGRSVVTIKGKSADALRASTKKRTARLTARKSRT